MDARTLIAAAVAAGMMAMTVALFAADQPAAGAAPKSEPIYGYRMMDDQERNDYRARMRNAGSADERQAIRDEHHQLMEARAKERGVTLSGPHGPGPQGMGKGPEHGPGTQGMGKGPGNGPHSQGKGPGHGPGQRADCPAGQECPGSAAGMGPRP